MTPEERRLTFIYALLQNAKHTVEHAAGMYRGMNGMYRGMKKLCDVDVAIGEAVSEIEHLVNEATNYGDEQEQSK